MGLISCTDAPTSCTNNTHDGHCFLLLYCIFSIFKLFTQGLFQLHTIDTNPKVLLFKSKHPNYFCQLHNSFLSCIERSHKLHTTNLSSFNMLSGLMPHSVFFLFFHSFTQGILPNLAKMTYNMGSHVFS
ncbi:hypothetical protein VPH35_045750 [Triticum aestivum]